MTRRTAHEEVDHTLRLRRIVRLFQRQRILAFTIQILAFTIQNGIPYIVALFGFS
jgi:hypothetical protein